MRPRFGRLVLAAAIPLALALVTAARTSDTGPVYRTVDLGTFDPDPFQSEFIASFGGAISDCGDVVGSAQAGGGVYHGFAWRDLNGNDAADPGEMVDLGHLGGGESQAYGISPNGRFVVGASKTENGQWRGFRWDDADGDHVVGAGEITPFEGGGGSSWTLAVGVNDSGQVCGSYYVDALQVRRGFVWSDLNGNGSADAGEQIDVGEDAHAINNAGHVVGAGRRADGYPRAFLFQDRDGDHASDDGETEVLEAPASFNPDPRYAYTVAYGVSEDGLVFGAASRDSRFHRNACLWRDSGGDGRADTGGFQDLDTVGLGESIAFDMAANGDVVGVATDWEQGVPVLFRSGEVILLRDLFPPGWINHSAVSINAAGRMATSGRYDYDPRDVIFYPPQVHAFMLVPGAPQAVLKSLTVTPSTIIGADTADVRVTLRAPVPYDCAYRLQENILGPVLYPDVVRVPAGQQSAATRLFTWETSTTQRGSVWLTTPDALLTTKVTVRPIGPRSLTVRPGAIIGGGGRVAAGEVLLERPAGRSVLLSSNGPAAEPAPSRLEISSDGSDGSGSFTVKTGFVTAPTTVILSARVSGLVKTAFLKVLPVTVKSVRLTPSTVVGAPDLTAESRAQVLLTAPAPPGGVTVALESSKPGTALPSAASLFIPEGSDGSDGSGAFTVDALPVPVSTGVAIRARLHGTTTSGVLTVRPISAGTLTLTPRTLRGGTGVEGLAVLNAHAPSGGLVVTLFSSHPDIAAFTDLSGHPISSLTIPEGADGLEGSGRFRIATSAVTTSTTVTIKAVANGIARTLTLSVRP
jgi:probable HAF family extracellular repeat protein